MVEDGAMWSQLELHEFCCAFKDPRFAHVIQHWLALQRNEGVPERGAVDPVQFRDCLDMVWLLERHDDGHYRYRLAGQTIVEVHGGIQRGTDTSHLFTQESLAMFQPRWEAVLNRGQLVRAEGVVTLADAKPSLVERLMLPLLSDDKKVSVVLGMTHYEKARVNKETAAAFPPTNIQCCPTVSIPSGACTQLPPAPIARNALIGQP